MEKRGSFLKEKIKFTNVFTCMRFVNEAYT
jgi:hypothetical protein